MTGMRKILAVMIVVSIILMTGCVPERKDNLKVLEYWKGAYYGWYEVTSASGEYVQFADMKSDCNVEIRLNHKAQLTMEVEDSNEAFFHYFTGNYDEDDNLEHGKIWMDEGNDAEGNSVVCDIHGMDAYDGISDFFVFSGTIGKEENQITVAFYLIPYGMLWDHIEGYDVPAGYEAYKREIIKQTKFDVFKEFMTGDYKASVQFTEGCGDLAAYEIESSDFPIQVRNNAPYEINYWLTMEEGKLVLFSEWEETNETVPVHMQIDWTGHNAVSRDYKSDVSVIIQSLDEKKSSVHVNGKIGDDENGLLIDVSFVIEKEFPYQ